MSKKRRENQKKREPLVLKPIHYIIGAAVLVASIAVAVSIFTILGGASLSADDGPNFESAVPALGPPLDFERSAAADILNDKTWDEMTTEEQALVQAEVSRAFLDARFRASNGFILALDVFKRGDQTVAARQYYALREPVGDQVLAEMLTFYCDVPGTPPVKAYKYEKVPTGTTLKEMPQEERTQPWDIALTGINWEQGVADLGFRDVQGRRTHGLRLVYNSNAPEVPGNRKEADYWFDVETAQLLQRQEVVPEQDSSKTRYTLQWRELPALDIPADQPQPDCVPEVVSLVNGQ